MSDTGTVAIFIAAAGLVLNIIIALRNGQWGLPDRLNQLEARIMNAVKEHRDHTDDILTQTRSELDAAMDRSRREFGETVHAMQAKIQQIELWARDTFVRRDSFMLVIQETKEAVEKQGQKLEQSLDRLNTKLDGVIERQLTRMGLPPTDP